MDWTTKKNFDEYNNSLLVAALLNRRDQYKVEVLVDTPDDNLTDNLGLVSALYIYTNVPPHGYGSQGPKVAETIKRAYDFNLKKQSKSIDIGGFHVERLKWEEEDGPFPFNETHGNYLYHDVKNMAKEFLLKNCSQIDICVERCIDKMMRQNADVLTKGRQTLDVFTHQSVTASVAYKRMYDFYREHLGQDSFCCLEWIQAFFQMLKKTEIEVLSTDKKEYPRKRYDRTKKQFVVKKIVKTHLKKKRLTNNEDVRKHMMNMSRSFASYLKNKERGKKDRRAIASAGMILRMFLYIIEDFHLSFSKGLQESTISQGGEDKKAKIINAMNAASLTHKEEEVSMQGTEDAKKWNENLPPEGFAVMHDVFFDPQVRKELNLPPPSEQGKVFRKLALSSHFLLAIKRVQLGPGPMAFSDENYNRLDWRTTELGRFNNSTRRWLEILRPKIDEENYLHSSPGMLMGMHNAASTTLGLLPNGYCLPGEKMKCVTIRSSDDSTTVYLGRGFDNLNTAVEINRRSLSAISINLSMEKSFFFDKGYGEFTSWYLDGKFISQFGVETSSLRPQGKNPPDDFFAIAKGTATNLGTLSINHIGATAKIVLGLDGVRRLWRIKKNIMKRETIGPKVLLLADGGGNPWDCTNCHLEEISIRELHANREEKKQYLLRITNPNNPFCAPPEEEITYSRELGTLVTSSVETPRTAFHFLKRSNRTVQNSIKKTMFQEEKINAEASDIVKTIDPSTHVAYPTHSVGISNHLIACLFLTKSEVELNQHELSMFNHAINILQKGKVIEDEEKMAVDSDSDD